MKCPNCGADMKDGLLYCEHCGEDIHIVPDFEPEIEYNLEQTLHGIVKDISETGESTEENTQTDGFEPVQETVEELTQDWDRAGAHKTGKHRKAMLIWLLGTVIVIAIIGTALGIANYRYNSVEFQAERAAYYTTEGEYDRAISFYSRALELAPGSIELKFALAEVYFLKNNKIEYEYLLRAIVKAPNATLEQLESAYGKLIAIYRARDDYKTINDLLVASNNESIMSIYQSYLALKPEFSIKEGYYNSIQPLKLTTFGTGKIYYTLDGSEPDADSLLYTAPILLESGDYCIKAIYINENGIASDVVTKKYHVEIEVLPAPEISVVSGDYQVPINIEVVGEEENVYYTTDGSVPTENSGIYTGPIPMPLGVSVFKFIVIENGKSSEVVERTYNLVLNTQLTPEVAVNTVVQYAIDIDKIDDETGYCEDSEKTYRYEYKYVTNINEINDFYIVVEHVIDEKQVASRTGNDFAVNVYTGELFKLQRDEQNNYILVEIEKEARE